jgi:hypothetical protein
MLTKEQQQDLNRLNEIYKKFEATASESDLAGDVQVQQFMMEDFPFLVPDRAHMNKLADMRKNLLQNKKSSNSPIQRLTDAENMQLSFE